MDYKENIAFNSKSVDNFNAWLESEFNYVFIAIDYSPKPFLNFSISNDSCELNFWIAITNLYGLYKDSADYILNYSWKDYMQQANFRQDFYSELFDYVKFLVACRSLFSHNQMSFEAESKKNINLISMFFQNSGKDNVRNVGNKITSSTLPFYFSINDDEWEIILNYICDLSEEIFNEYTNTLKQNILLNTYGRNIFLSKWEKSVVDWFSNNNIYKHQAAKELYEYWKSIDSSLNGYRFKNWYKNIAWDNNDIKNIVRSMSEPSSPIDILTEYIIKYVPYP